MSDNVQYENAKARVAHNIGFVWRFYDDYGNGLISAALRDDFAASVQHIQSLSELWAFISDPLKYRLKEMTANPSVNVILASGKSWADYEMDIINLLEKGEHLSFSELTK